MLNTAMIQKNELVDSKLSGGEMLIQALVDEGVDIIFGYPGGSALHIYDALFKNPDIQHILVRHEQAATHAADGYARATGKVGTVLVTSGPGATNAITGIATAYMDSIPMVVISGQVMSDKIGEDAFQETDMMGISRPIVKHSFLVKDQRDIPTIVKKAFYIARSGRPGPVVIDVPKDLTNPTQKFDYQYPENVVIRSYAPALRGHRGQIKKAVDLLLSARRPIIYYGGGVVLGDASEQLIALAKTFDYPVTSTLMGLGAYPGTDDQFLGMLGMHGTVEANQAMHHADVILALGARFDDRVTNIASNFCPHAKIIHVDIDPASISKTVKCDVPIVGSVGSVITDMLALLKEETAALAAQDITFWWRQINEWRERYGIYVKNNYDETSQVLNPQEVIKALFKSTAGNAFVTSDVGQHQMFAAQYYRFNKPRRWINSGGLGTMGFGLPAAMGVKLFHRDEDVVCVTGEGSIQMCIQELSTCLQYDLPIKIICINNQSLGMVKQWQDMQYNGRYSQSLYENSLPDFVALAEAYGHVGMRVTERSELQEKMDECLSLKNKLVFMDIRVTHNSHVYPMQIASPESSMRDMWVRKGVRT